MEQQRSFGTDIRTIVFGAFKAMGDLLCASPVIRSELDAGSRVHLLVFNNNSLFEFARLIDFGPNQDLLTLHFLPVPARLQAIGTFLREMSSINPDLVWVSPHAPAPASSWRIPALLRFVKALYWERAKLAGADSERMSFLFDRRISVDRKLPFVEREWEAFHAIRGGAMGVHPVRIAFLPEIMRLRYNTPAYDLLIHPGANAKNRSWPFQHYAEVVQNLPKHYRIGVVGLPKDVAAMKAILPMDHNIDFMTGTLKESLIALARSRVLLTMDSGNVHFARVLGVPAVALFGKSDPINVIALNDGITAIYERKFTCQPCEQAVCSQPEVYCMNSLSPELIVKAIMQTMAGVAEEQDSSVPTNLVQLPS
jgi:heptosyltransferase-2